MVFSRAAMAIAETTAVARPSRRRSGATQTPKMPAQPGWIAIRAMATTRSSLLVADRHEQLPALPVGADSVMPGTTDLLSP